MRGPNQTHGGAQTYVEKTRTYNPEARGQLAKCLAKWPIASRNVSDAPNVQVVVKGQTVDPKPPLASQPALRDLTISGVNVSSVTGGSAARGATVSVSSETKSAARPSVVETLKMLDILVCSVKGNFNERSVKLSYKGKDVTLRRIPDKEGRLQDSVAVCANDDIKNLLIDELFKHDLTFLDLVTDLEPKDATGSSGIFSFFNSLWS